MKQIKVFLACALGASISFFSDALKEAAKAQGVELITDTNTVDESYTIDLMQYDLIIVAPQVRWHAGRIRERVENKIPVEEISGLVFATLDGKAGFEQYILPHIKD
jgi:cellobiose PTS system EIIB component